jgi:hypothetical protein
MLVANAHVPYNDIMERVIRNVRDIDPEDRRALERIVGQALHDNQQLIIEVTEIDVEREAGAVGTRPPQTQGSSIADTYPAQESALASIWGSEPQLDEYSESDGDEFLPHAHEAFAEDWDAPGMEAYDDYDGHKQSRS